MYVSIYYVTKTTLPGMVQRTKEMTVTMAKKYYREKIEPIATKAYLVRWDGWHDQIYKRLKGCD